MADSSIDTVQSLVLACITTKLRTALSLNCSTCYETLDPLVAPNIPPGGNYIVTVALGDGTFPREMQEGGGFYQVEEDSGVVVSAWTKPKLDRPDQARIALHEEARGLLVVKRKILEALTGQQLFDESGNPLLRNYIYAMHAYRPAQDPASKLYRISVEFGVDFDWDLTT